MEKAGGEFDQLEIKIRQEGRFPYNGEVIDYQRPDMAQQKQTNDAQILIDNSSRHH